eukprot:TRINITY_DN96116_c0_g1_i1.p1 TRINITY_DN96116_c0_g1~~TRINITY_DN96116_c0_g1_i1.p1  ORF type:complete len:363 (-),score=20.53 TRINITY_DN96116_c0_g1_i1:86-1174(-)
MLTKALRLLHPSPAQERVYWRWARRKFPTGTYVAVSKDLNVVQGTRQEVEELAYNDEQFAGCYIQRIGWENYPKELTCLPFNHKPVQQDLEPHLKYWTIRDQYKQGTYVAVLPDGRVLQGATLADVINDDAFEQFTNHSQKKPFVACVGQEGYPHHLDVLLDPNSTPLSGVLVLGDLVEEQDGEFQFAWSYHDHEGERIHKDDYKAISGLTRSGRPFLSLPLRCMDDPNMVVPATFLVDTGSLYTFVHPKIAKATATVEQGVSPSFKWLLYTNGFKIPADSTCWNDEPNVDGTYGYRDTRFECINLLGLDQFCGIKKRHAGLLVAPTPPTGNDILWINTGNKISGCVAKAQRPYGPISWVDY